MGANAQTSVPAFTSGQVLTAAQVTQINTGIPVFASSTERDAAFGGTGEKTLAEGQMAYLEDTDVTQVYDGSAWTAISGANWQTYTPVLTNWTATSVTGRYIQIGKLVHVFFDAGGTIICSGVMQATLPVAAANQNRLDGHHGIMLEGGVAYYPCFTAALSATAVQIHAMTQSGSSVRWLLTSATIPFTWGVGDQVTISFTYEAA